MLNNNPWIFDINIPPKDDSAVVELMYYLMIELENYVVYILVIPE